MFRSKGNVGHPGHTNRSPERVAKNPVWFSEGSYKVCWGGFHVQGAQQRSSCRAAKGTLNLTCFHASFFPFCPFCWPPLFLPLSRHLFAIFLPSKSALFCRGKGTVQSLERGSSGMDLSTKFGKEIPSRNLREKRSGTHKPRNGLLRTLSGSRKVLRRPVRGLPWTGCTETLSNQR